LKYNKNEIIKVNLEELRRTYKEVVVFMKIILFQNKKHRIVAVSYDGELKIHLQKVD
jgi:hypothetical protein